MRLLEKITFYEHFDSQETRNFESFNTSTIVVMKSINLLAAFIGGAAVGAVCGILFAPEKGSETRSKIAEALRKRGIQLDRKEMEHLVDDIAAEMNAASK